MVACKQQRRTSQVTYVETARCINDVQRRAFEDIHQPYMDLHYTLSAAAAHRGGSRRAHITEAEADARLADATAAAQNEHRRRREDAAMQRAAIGTMNAATTSAYVDMITAGLSAMR